VPEDYRRGSAGSKSASGVASSDPASACHSGRVITVKVGDPDRVLCTVGSLTLSAHCELLYGDRAVGSLLIASSTEHAFVASDVSSDASFGPSDPAVAVAVSRPSTGRAAVNDSNNSFEAAEAPSVGGRHLGGTAVIRSHYRPDATPPLQRCSFAVDALMS
jgi:hypothetical protein